MYKRLYDDVLSIVFSYLTLKEIVYAGLTHKNWLHVGTQIPCRKESFSHKRDEPVSDAVSAIISRYGYHITSWDLSHMFNNDDEEIFIIHKTIEQNKFISSINLSNNISGEHIKSTMDAIQKSPCPITSLNLNTSHLLVEDIQIVADALKNMTGLKIIDLGCNYFGNDEDGIVALSSIIDTHFKTLEQIHLNYNSIYNTEIELIATAIQKCRSLKLIDLSSNDFDSDGVEFLMSAIEQSPSPIASIILYGISIGDSGANIVASALKNKQSVTFLDLNICSFGDEGAQSLLSVIQRSKSISNINFGFNKNITNVKSFQAISNAINRNHQIISLNLGGISFNIDKIRIIGNCIAQSKTLRSIDFKSCGFGAKCLHIIADAIKKNSSLTFIDLGYNKSISDNETNIRASMEAISDAVATSLSMITFEFVGNISCHSHAQIISNGISRCQTIKNINLSNNSICLESLKILANCCSQISEIDFSSCRFDYQDVNIIAYMILKNKSTISSINLNCCHLGFKSAKIIAEVAATIPSLTSINLGSNGYWKSLCT